MKKYKVILLSKPEKYLKVIARIQHLLNIKLAEAKELVDNTPITVAEFNDRKDAVKLEVLLKDCDAEVSITEG